MKKKRLFSGCLIIVGCSAILFIISHGLLFLPFSGQLIKDIKQTRGNVSAMKKPAVYEPTCKTLALYCQSDQSCFPEYLTKPWLPVELRNAIDGYGGNYPCGCIQNDSAQIILGGGFYHFGYLLERDDSACTETTNT